ncbi:MobA/MobL family protein [Lactiplantibacillus plantarum]|uniref:MobQ family relaxase n=1 Tax=Lactiplantibacillus plantarum TaxID=1590 RepID=UPI001AAF6880|nr:MobQ family relaxase [Lactiplantibacillus plantarum]MBO2714509.1 MobA/MobL family protein [Lactiplantibacillus plantarum]
MAIYHLSLKTISRSKGQSAVASSAYRSGDKLKDRETGETKDFTRKHGVAYSEIQLPTQAPAEYRDREELWNAVQSKESRRNSQLAREVEVALPAELDRDTQVKLVHDYVQQNFVDKGMCADWSIHDKEDGNPHAHIMLTTRAIKKNGTWAPKQKSTYLLDENGAKVPQIDSKTGQQKIGARGRKMWKRTTESYTDWNDRSNAETWRKSWADSCNRYLKPGDKIDHRSYERQGVEQVPTIHEGHVAREMGDRSERIQINEKIKTGNTELEGLSAVIAKVQEEARTLRQRIVDLIELMKKRAEAKRLAKAEQPTQSTPAPRSAEPTPNIADDFLQKLNADKAKRTKPEPLEKSVAGDFLKKLDSDRGKKRARKEREQTVEHNQGGPEL